MRFILCRAMDFVWALESARVKFYLRKCKMGKYEFLERWRTSLSLSGAQLSVGCPKAILSHIGGCEYHSRLV